MPVKWVPTSEDRRKAENLAGIGVPHKMIGILLGVDDETLRSHLTPELKLGEARATSKVAQTLFDRATEGKELAAAIFWLKARAGWREKQPEEGDGALTIRITGGLPE